MSGLSYRGVLLQSVKSVQKLDSQLFSNFYRSVGAEFGFGPNTKNLLNMYPYLQKNLRRCLRYKSILNVIYSEGAVHSFSAENVI